MSRRWFPRAIGLPLLLLMGVAYPQARPEQAAAPAASPAPTAEQALLNRYCAGCHNEKTKQGNFVLSTLDVANVGADAERWESVVRKLRARSMPPMGRPRPAEADYDSLVSHLETSLDRVAAANPDPGRTDTFRRLNRTEYQNAIRDLLDLEIDVEGDAAERRLEPRLRQHQRRRTLADAPRTLPVGGAEDQPARGGHARALRRCRDGCPSSGSHAGRSLRRPAVRHACWHERAVTRFRPMATISSSFGSRAIATS